jgi:hypothetical protein
MSDDAWRAAIHEAAHAVACWRALSRLPPHSRCRRGSPAATSSCCARSVNDPYGVASRIELPVREIRS